jgi:hypothetical protein
VAVPARQATVTSSPDTVAASVLSSLVTAASISMLLSIPQEGIHSGRISELAAFRKGQLVPILPVQSYSLMSSHWYSLNFAVIRIMIIYHGPQTGNSGARFFSSPDKFPSSRPPPS